MEVKSSTFRMSECLNMYTSTSPSCLSVCSKQNGKGEQTGQQLCPCYTVRIPVGFSMTAPAQVGESACAMNQSCNFRRRKKRKSKKTEQTDVIIKAL